MPILVIDTGQHFDDTLGFGIKEFELQRFVGCNLQIRGDLMEKASELLRNLDILDDTAKNGMV